MTKIRIKLITLGHLPHINLNRISDWKSDVFELVGIIENYQLNCNSDSETWGFSDSLLNKQIPNQDASIADVLIVIVNVPLENNYYSRRLTNNRIIFTLYGIKDYLASENIPPENAILRVIYATTLLHRRSGNKIPSVYEDSSFLHDETRGCLFDMTGIKTDLVYSTNRPIICNSCEDNLLKNQVSTQMIKYTQREIRRIRKNLYYRTFDFIKRRPITALIISSFFALSIGTIGSLIASFIYDHIRP